MDALVIMAKEPKPNEVKTRLIPTLKPEFATELYHNFLLDKINQVHSFDAVHPYLAYFPESAESFFREIVPQRFFLIRQAGSNLGERLDNISKRLNSLHYTKIIMLDSDTPNLPTSYISDGLSGLDEADVVLGPCEDGGYYLIGAKASTPELFRDIPWSTTKVTEMTLKNAEEADLKLRMLDYWYDVDTPESLKRLKDDLDKDLENGKVGLYSENTYKVLQRTRDIN